MKIHNASNENASVTLKPREIGEITTLGFDSLRIIQELLNTISEVHDNGENCPICGEDYTGRDTGLDLVCSNDECAFNKAQQFLEDSSQTLHTFKLVCTDLGVATPIDLA